MRNYFKKFSIMFMMALMLVLGWSISAFAADEGVVGTSNLNNTAENSAKVGDVLKTPEIGWKRYDDTNSNISYIGSAWATESLTGEYKLTNHFITENPTVEVVNRSRVRFNFVGSKIRFIQSKYPSTTSDLRYSIDGIELDGKGDLSGTCTRQVLCYEKNGLEFKEHYVDIYSGNGIRFDFDAVDIDENGQLKPYDGNIVNKSITLDKSTMNIAAGDSQQLTATTTPAGAQVTWSSSDTSVATVDSNGKVTGVSAGTCTITTKTADGLTAKCVVTVTASSTGGGTTTGDANLYIELVDGQIKQYSVSQDEINKFTSWFENRDKDHSLPATYKFTKGTYKDYVVHDQIDWFEVR